jgi:hypothetical protein
VLHRLLQPHAAAGCSPILMEVTRSPQFLSSTPMLLAVTPFPSPETTPPVTSTYFMATEMGCCCCCCCWLAEEEAAADLPACEKDTSEGACNDELGERLRRSTPPHE